jgi:hypothetical protein
VTKSSSVLAMMVVVKEAMVFLGEIMDNQSKFWSFQAQLHQILATSQIY